MALHTLSARSVQAAQVGIHQDGGGLSLVVTETGANWIFRFTAPDGRRREMGLGPALRSTLAAAGETITLARRAAGAARELLIANIDPIEKRKADRGAAQAATSLRKAAKKAEATTLSRVARRYHEEVIEPQRSEKHSAQWIASLERSVPATIWNAPIDRIEPPELLKAIAELQARVPVTSARVRQRLEVVFDDAIFHKLCTINPARVIRRKLAERPKGKTKGNFRALPYTEVPAFVRELRAQPGTAVLMLELALLTAARTGEVIQATWDEFDTRTGIWRIPGKRMKGGEEHIVHLTSRALEIVEAMKEHQGKPWVFPSPRDATKPHSNMSMLALLRRMGLATHTTVHGLCRSSFSTWANETGAARPDVIEACLAHKEEDKVRRAYNRASFTAERARLLRDWAAFCGGEPKHAAVPDSAEQIRLAA